MDIVLDALRDQGAFFYSIASLAARIEKAGEHEPVRLLGKVQSLSEACLPDNMFSHDR
jgi:hypothetical protein